MRLIDACDLAAWLLALGAGDVAGTFNARETGLATRPLAQTIRDTAQWLATRDNAGAWKTVLGADVERRLLAR